MLKETRLNEYNKDTKWLDNDLFISLKLAQVIVETLFDKPITYVQIIQCIHECNSWIISLIDGTMVRYTDDSKNLGFDSLSITADGKKVITKYYKKGIEIDSDESKHPYPKLDLSIFDIINAGQISKDRLSQWFTQVEEYLPQVYKGHILTLKDLIKQGLSTTYHSTKKYHAIDLLFEHYKWVIKKYGTVDSFFTDYFNSNPKRQKLKRQKMIWRRDRESSGNKIKDSHSKN